MSGKDYLEVRGDEIEGQVSVIRDGVDWIAEAVVPGLPKIEFYVGGLDEDEALTQAAEHLRANLGPLLRRLRAN